MSDFVSLPVRVEVLPQVLRVMADLEEALAASAEQADSVTTVAAVAGSPTERSPGGLRSNPGRAWTNEEYRRLRAENTVSAEKVRRIMTELLSDGAPTAPVSMSHLAALTGYKSTEIRAALSWLSRFLHAHEGEFRDDQWPFGWSVGAHPDRENPNEFHYEMTQEQVHGWVMNLGHDADLETLDTDYE